MEMCAIPMFSFFCVIFLCVFFVFPWFLCVVVMLLYHVYLRRWMCFACVSVVYICYSCFFFSIVSRDFCSCFHFSHGTVSVLCCCTFLLMGALCSFLFFIVFCLSCSWFGVLCCMQTPKYGKTLYFGVCIQHVAVTTVFAPSKSWLMPRISSNDLCMCHAFLSFSNKHTSAAISLFVSYVLHRRNVD